MNTKTDTSLPESGQNRYRLQVEYDGTEYCGWQVQPSDKTVQSEIEKVLGQLYGFPVRITGSGRTDTGVHALRQVAHFDASDRFDPVELNGALNHFLPDDIIVHGVKLVESGFHARFDAKWRWYRYRIFNRVRAVERQYGWFHKHEFDAAILHQCADRLPGEHDFKAFAASDPVMEHYRCLVTTARWVEVGDEWHFHIVANRFLRHMVRSLVGTMIDVGRGRFSVMEFEILLANHHKDQSLYTAPPQGLCLMQVGYDQFPKCELDLEQKITLPFEIDEI